MKGLLGHGWITSLIRDWTGLDFYQLIKTSEDREPGWSCISRVCPSPTKSKLHIERDHNLICSYCHVTMEELCLGMLGLVRTGANLCCVLVSVTSEYPQDGGWSALLWLPRLCVTKDCMVSSALCVMRCVIFDSCTCRTIIPTRWQPREKGWRPVLEVLYERHACLVSFSCFKSCLFF